MHVAFVLALLGAAAVTASGPSRLDQLPHEQLLEKRVACKKPKAVNQLPGLNNPATCYKTVSTNKIDDKNDGLQVGTINNWADGNVPAALRGIFYLEGNPYHAECYSTGTAVWNATTNTFDSHLYQPKTWTSDQGKSQLKQNLEEGTVFQTSCKTNFWGRQSCLTQQWNQNGQTLQHSGDYTAVEVSDNQWNRASNVFGGTGKSILRYSYRMYRIVDENGVRTDKWDKNYIPNIGKTVGPNSGQVMVHLGTHQEVPALR